MEEEGKRAEKGKVLGRKPPSLHCRHVDGQGAAAEPELMGHCRVAVAMRLWYGANRAMLITC